MTNVERVTEYAIETILRWSDEDVDVACQVANALASLDWQQVIIEKHQKEKQSQMLAMKKFLDWWNKGGRFCDDCEFDKRDNYVGGYHHGPMYTSTYIWPYTISPYSYTDIGMTYGQRYCRKCFYKMQRDIEVEIIRAYRDSHPDLPSGTFVQWKDRLSECDECGRLFPTKAGYKFKQDKYQYNIYCLHCVEVAAERQFTICQICNKKTANATADFCYDCYPISRSLSTQISGHLARAREANTAATLTVGEWAATIAQFHKKCAYCRIRPFQVLEHFLPISLGGGTTADNCVPSCTQCNTKKNRMHPHTFTTIFPQETIEYITSYLHGDKQKCVPYNLSGRELVVVGE